MTTMKQERVILSFIMVLIGLLVAGIAFYLYQGTKTIPASKLKPVSITTPSPSPVSFSTFLSVQNPTDESVLDNKILTVSGKTTPDATVVILTASDQKVIQPSNEGDFSTTITLSDGQNLIQISAISPDGQSATVQKTVTYSTENF